MIAIRNDMLQVVVSEKGAEMQSIRFRGQEYLWQGHPDAWSEHAPVLFPICSRLIDNRYILNGKEYEMPVVHGFGRYLDFEVEYHDGESLVMLATDNEETRKQFPFAFDLRISYQLKGNTIKIGYDVLNKSEETMYFSIGAHEGYALPGGLTDYKLVFPQKETFETHRMAGGGLIDRWDKIQPDGNILELKPELMDYGTLIFDKSLSKSCVLARKDGSRAIRVNYQDFKYFLVWTVPGYDFVCLEPWCGLPDEVGTDHDITHKTGIIRAWPNETVSRFHSIEILT